MRFVNFAIAAVIMAGFNSPPGFADYFVHNGHLCGPHTTLALTASQISALSRGAKVALTPYQKKVMLKISGQGIGTAIVLTPNQKKVMLQATGVSGVKEVYVYPRMIGDIIDKETVANVALRISNKSIEVADSEFGLDLAAQNRYCSDCVKCHDEWLAAQRAERRLLNPPKEVQLLRQAEKLEESGQSKSAIPLLQQAIEINPNYKWARRNLAGVYKGMAGSACGPASELSRKIYYCKRALNVVNGDDVTVIRQIQQTLDRINARIAANNCKRIQPCYVTVDGLAKVIDKHWKPKAPCCKKATAEFKLNTNKQGCIVDIVKMKSSGIASFDTEAYNVLRTAAVGKSVTGVKADQTLSATFVCQVPKNGSNVTKVELSLESKSKTTNIGLKQGWLNAKLDIKQQPPSSSYKIEHGN